jgi:hypothetical protein
MGKSSSLKSDIANKNVQGREIAVTSEIYLYRKLTIKRIFYQTEALLLRVIEQSKVIHYSKTSAIDPGTP